MNGIVVGVEEWRTKRREHEKDYSWEIYKLPHHAPIIQFRFPKITKEQLKQIHTSLSKVNKK